MAACLCEQFAPIPWASTRKAARRAFYLHLNPKQLSAPRMVDSLNGAMPPMTLSVAIATFNGASYIKEQLASLAEQTCAPSELVISDDCSEDRTLAIVEEFAQSAVFPVRIHRNKSRLGYRGNFMQAASLCSSEIVSFCDQDDVWHPLKLQVVLDSFQDPEVLLTYHNAEVVDENATCLGTTSVFADKQVSGPMGSDPRRYSLGFTQSFRRSLLPFTPLWTAHCSELPANKQIPHDQWFFFLAAAFGKTVYLPEVLASYRQHSQNTFGWRTPPGAKRRFAALKFPQSSFQYWGPAFAMRADVLDAAIPSLTGEWRSRAITAAAAFRKLGFYYSQRTTLYTASSILNRMAAFHALCRNNAYRSDPTQRLWAFGPRSLVKDFCLALPFGSHLSVR